MKKLWLTIILMIFFSLTWSEGDLYNDESSSINVESNNVSKYISNYKSTLAKEFYSENNYNMVWVDSDHLSVNAENLINILSTAYLDGLDPETYHTSKINSLTKELKNSPSNDIQANLDTILTDAFFLYAKDINNGVVKYNKLYPNWLVNKHDIDLIDKLNNALQNNNITQTLDSLTPKYTEYEELKKQLAIYQDLLRKIHNWQTVPSGAKLKLGIQDKRVAELKKRLVASGELEYSFGFDNNVFDKNLQNAVIKFQKENGLFPDGVVGKTTFEALNISLIHRIKQIELNMDRLRILPENLGESYIIVNIPDFSLKVVDKGKTILTMPVIVGRDDGLQSCVLSSQITYMDINPYWYIPRSIAVKDILPKVKKDPNYLANKNIKMYTSYSESSTEIDSTKINWTKINASNFIYKLKQEPGPDNPLGHIKFIFQNACGIYLHDTSTPELFNSHRRDLSHGCIRIGKPVELAAFLASDKPQWSTDKINQVFDSDRSHVIVTLTNPMDIHIVYATSFVNESGILQFRNDIYGIDDIDFKVVVAP